MNYKELVDEFGKGLMSKAQYEEISKELFPLCPCNVLVFGLGNDSYLWNEINKGGLTIFLEDDPTWISNFLNSNLKIQLIKYNTKVEDHQSIKFEESKIKIEIPKELITYCVVSGIYYSFVHFIFFKPYNSCVYF